MQTVSGVWQWSGGRRVAGQAVAGVLRRVVAGVPQLEGDAIVVQLEMVL